MFKYRVVNIDIHNEAKLLVQFYNVDENGA